MKINELLETRYAPRKVPDSGIPAAEIRRAILMVVPEYKQIPGRFLKTWKSRNSIASGGTQFGIFLVDDPKRYVRMNKSRPVDDQTHQRVREIISRVGGLVFINDISLPADDRSLIKQELLPTQNAKRIVFAIANQYGLKVDRIGTMQHGGEQSIQVRLAPN